ncbi:hypothetical protein [Intrasporangium calvum]|uniref:hypothetical protein n=1 Tax=Intrasporangium calvum TaxID=53358 RepID=UPI0012374C0F|nr:hypothetical protein [Intrasporangium calvum]
MATIERPVTTPSEMRHPETIAPRRNAWVAWLMVILLAVGLAAGFLIGRATVPEAEAPAPPRDLAGTTVSQLLTDYAAVVDSGVKADIAGLYATDATMSSNVAWMSDEPWLVTGDQAIASAIRSWWEYQGFRLDNAGTAIQKGDLVMQSFDSVFGPAMMVFQFDNGKIVNQWILQAVR